MTEKREEFLKRVEFKEERDEANIFLAAKIESERINREKEENERISNLPDRGNVIIAARMKAREEAKKMSNIAEKETDK